MKVLIVDDNSDNRMTIELLLEDMGSLSIANAINGEEAVKKCKQTNFDLIFMDIMMPIMNGIEATKAIKSFAKNSMIIALSALDDDKSKQDMLQSGAEDYMTKPIESDLFIQRVKNYIDIIVLRNTGAKSSQTFMLFTEKVYPSVVTFQIDSESSLAYFWGYYLNNADQKSEMISDVVRMLYGFGLLLLKHKNNFKIIAEENDKQLFLTQSDISFIGQRVIKNILHKHAPDAVYIVNDNSVSFKLNKSFEDVNQNNDKKQELENITDNEEDKYKKDILSKTHFNKLSAAVYVEQTAINYMEKIDELEELEDRLDQALIVFEEEPNKINMRSVSNIYIEYVEILELLVDFEHISFALSSLAKFITTVEPSEFESSSIKKFVTLNIHLISDLRDWRENIFIKQEANDIHYLDSSLLSSCLQIESIFTPDSDENEDGLEFF